MAESKVLRLPNFIGIGPGRTGTTWLHHALSSVAGLPAAKETWFFQRRYYKGVEWYASHFRKCGERGPLGEICPYFTTSDAIGRIHSLIPNCQIICTIRDPLTRTYSQYRQWRRLGLTSGTFEEALESLPGMSEESRYAHYLRQWQKRFGNDRVLVTFFDDMVEAPRGYLDRICEFIGARPVELSEETFSARARNSIARQYKRERLARIALKFGNRLREHDLIGAHRALTVLGVWRYCFKVGEPFPDLDPEVEARVRRRFLPEVAALEEMLGRDLSAWKAPRARVPRRSEQVATAQENPTSPPHRLRG